MKKALLSILTTAVLSLFIISCGKDNNAISPIISLDKSIKENGSILDIIVCCSTTFNEAQKKLSDSKCSFYDEDECLKSEQPTTFCGFPSNFEIYFIDDIVSECYSDIFFDNEEGLKEAQNTLLEYLQKRAQDVQDLNIYQDTATGTYYIPLGKFNYEDESQVLYATLTLTTFEENEYPEGYINSGYEISEEYASLTNWEIITSPDSEDLNNIENTIDESDDDNTDT